MVCCLQYHLLLLRYRLCRPFLRFGEMQGVWHSRVRASTSEWKTQYLLGPQPSASMKTRCPYPDLATECKDSLLET